MLIDVHCHLDMLEDIKLVIERARKKRVTTIVSQGTTVATNRAVLNLCARYGEIKAALGLYPIDSLGMKEKEIESEFNFIRNNKDKVIAIGEVGLDLKEDKEQFTKQQRVFQQAIDLAKELSVPIIVHSRKAELQCIIQLEQNEAKKVVMHCFSGKLSLVKRIIENGWSLSIPTSVKNSEHFQKVIELVPLDHLLCETDSPYLHPDRGFPNEPANVLVSYELIAKIKKLTLGAVEKQIEKNYLKLFS
jgi:TatD DNase family protein